jgi:hypothetical protein
MNQIKKGLDQGFFELLHHSNAAHVGEEEGGLLLVQEGEFGWAALGVKSDLKSDFSEVLCGP